MDVKDIPRIKAEAGEYVIIETTKGGITMAETLVRVDEYSFDCKNKIATVELVASPIINGFIPKETKYKLP